MKENKVGTYSFVAEPFHVDFTGKLFMMQACGAGFETAA